MSLDVTIQFVALLTEVERTLLACLPDWPDELMLMPAHRPAASRLKRLGCIGLGQVGAGVTPLGREAQASGKVRLS